MNDIVYLVLIDGPRGEGRVRGFTEEEMQTEGFWQDVGEILGEKFATYDAAEQALESWLASLPEPAEV